MTSRSFIEAPPHTYLPLSISGGIRSAMTREPGKTALHHGSRAINYRDLVTRIDRVSTALCDGLGLTAGRHVAIAAANCIEFVELLAGAAQVGVPVVTINPRLALPEIVAICDDAQVEILFADSSLFRSLRDAGYASVRAVMEIGTEYENWLAAARPLTNAPAIPEWSVFTIPYTSGTTGRPKGVLISHRSRILNWYGLASEYGCYGPDDTFVASVPMSAGAGVTFCLATLFFGGTVDLLSKFEPAVVVEKLKSRPVTGTFLVPAQFHAIFEQSPVLLDKFRGRGNLKAIISNAAPLPQATKHEIIDYWGEGLLHELYGSSEASIVSSLRPRDQLRKLSCVGTPFPGGLVRIVDEAGRECAPGESGELLAKNPSLFNGYWNNPDETAAAFRDGWVGVGDVARRDEEGFIYIVDRKKDMVISGGFNIYPREIEELVHTHPAVSQVAVVGVPDAKWGERLKAFVVAKPGQSFTLDDLRVLCDGRLASFKIPRELALLPSLPRNANGKVLKTELRALG